ncbi:FecR/PupR family sigma factor regulator [Pseudomonas aeruginosa]|nr:FecR/PupR family sigma factor regulator [Pseudomonas aeruginosa]
MELEIEVLEAAATWYVRFGAEPPNDGERQAWREWLEADPRAPSGLGAYRALAGPMGGAAGGDLLAHAGRRACAAPSAAQDARPAGLRRG